MSVEEDKQKEVKVVEEGEVDEAEAEVVEEERNSVGSGYESDDLRIFLLQDTPFAIDCAGLKKGW